ncbi:HK97 family phage major capsid protein [Tepidamorphus gemmatus]|uniref:HK97 family phage major capsid protein n=1 Tax=Tepidamorphus gemmatus TaxID=747076 RepID=A0A4R3LWD1_9HYPH|nr:phage major capsid protein [Tepidamorphus gemmatus]TCT02817.1 HK97 family phage major capsid protein [Tepidamorphus gemmatus]
MTRHVPRRSRKEEEAPPAPVRSAPTSLEVVEAFDEFMMAFEAFKEANDERLRQIEERVSADVVTTEKMERINRALDEHRRLVDTLVLKQRRPHLSSGRDTPYRDLQHKAAFESYVRRGAEHELRALEAKAMSAGSDADGGYLVPEETEREIGQLLSQASPIRAIAGIREISASVYKKPFAITGPATGWVAETAARPQTDGSTLAELSFPAMELYAMPAATQTLLDDAAVDIDAWIAAEVQTAFAEQEGLAFVSGNGVNKPKGFLAYDTVAESAWEWGKIGYLATGVDGDLPSANPSDRLIDLVYALKAGYRQNAHWVMNRRLLGAIRKIKDADGNYIWQPPAQAGGVSTLLNFPVAEAEDMPDAAEDSFSIAFGDFRRGYLIVDRLGVRILRDPYSAKPYVLFYTTKRVGGGVQDFDAIKLMKFGES